MKTNYTLPSFMNLETYNYYIEDLDKLMNWNDFIIPKAYTRAVIHSFCNYFDIKKPVHLTNRQLLDYAIEMLNHEVQYFSEYNSRCRCIRFINSVFNYFDIKYYIS